jgi:hypothetical protein
VLNNEWIPRGCCREPWDKAILEARLPMAPAALFRMEVVHITAKAWFSIETSIAILAIARQPSSPDGEIGRRSGLKIRRPQGRGGSSPPPGTNKEKGLRGNVLSKIESKFRLVAVLM